MSRALNTQQAGNVTPVRFRPRPGQALTLACIHGLWRPSGAVAGVGVFAVIWSTGQSDFWAPLHDFEPAATDRLIEACCALDQEVQ